MWDFSLYVVNLYEDHNKIEVIQNYSGYHKFQAIYCPYLVSSTSPQHPRLFLLCFFPQLQTYANEQALCWFISYYNSSVFQGSQDNPQVHCFNGTHKNQPIVILLIYYSKKGYEPKSAKEKVRGVKSEGNQTKASRSPLPGSSTGHIWFSQWRAAAISVKSCLQGKLLET